jgi:hypothetical protein
MRNQNTPAVSPSRVGWDSLEAFVRREAVRDSQTDIYVNWSREMVDPNWKPHSSWHASGQYHQKSFNHKILPIQRRQKPQGNFHGTENLVTTEARLASVRALNLPCSPADFAGVVEIPSSELPPESQFILSIDLTASTSASLVPTSVCPWYRIVQQNLIQDALPWIAVTLFETGAPGRQ